MVCKSEQRQAFTDGAGSGKQSDRFSKINPTKAIEMLNKDLLPCTKYVSITHNNSNNNSGSNLPPDNGQGVVGSGLESLRSRNSGAKPDWNIIGTSLVQKHESSHHFKTMFKTPTDKSSMIIQR